MILQGGPTAQPLHYKLTLMQRPQVSIIHDASDKHTKRAARFLSESLSAKGMSVNLQDVATPDFQVIGTSDLIIFGSPTLFGTVSAAFKVFMESTQDFWYRQPWKDKLAAAFTVSPTTSGDKLTTLQTLALFASHHSMQWVSVGVLPRFINGEQTEGQNRFSSFLGVMLQSCDNEETCFHPGDLLTLELFANRIHEVVNNHQHITNK